MFNFCVWCGMLAKVSEETKMTSKVIHVLNLLIFKLIFICKRKKATNKQKCKII